jgi:hypothetical protein
MAQDIVNLEAFKTQRTPDPDLPMDESLAGGIGTSYAIVGYKGKTWSLRYRGETHLFKNSKGELMQSINIVVLHAAPGKSKSYFPKYDEGSTDPPLCASIDGIVPDDSAEQKQAEACAICPHNELKTLPNGRKGKECTDYKRLAVALMPNDTQRMFGEPLLEPVFLRVPPASLNSLVLLEQRMGPKGLGYHFSAYLTRIKFVELGSDGKPMAYPQMEFYAVRPLEPAEMIPIKDMRKDPQCQRITGEGGNQGRLTGPTSSNVNLVAFTAAKALPNPAQAKTLDLAPNQPSPATTGQPTAPVAAAASEDEGTGLGLASAKPPAAPTVSPSEDTGLGAPTGETKPVEASGEPQRTTTVADTGEPEESDAELDARIAGVMTKAK